MVEERDNVSGDALESFPSGVTTTSTNLAISTSHERQVIEATATLSLTLLSSADAGEGFLFNAVNNGSGDVTIDPDGSETINGSSTLVLAPGESALCVNDGAKWIANYVVPDASITQSKLASDIFTLFVPAACVVPYAGTSAPTGWLFCYGQAISRATYSDLFTAIGTTYGSGDGSTTFNLPDMRGRVTAGKDNMGGVSSDTLTGLSGGIDGDTLGAIGGSESHVLTEAQLPTHTHDSGTLTTSSDGDHTHGIPDQDAGSGVLGVTSNGNHNPTGSIQTESDGAHTHSITGATASAGSDAAHNNVQPTIILNYIIKT